MKRAVAVRLKIPDNEAYTALTALRRLGLEVAHLDRSEIWVLDDEGSAQDLAARFERNETLFNPNKHRLEVLDEVTPRAGELWVEPLDAAAREIRVDGVRGARRFIGWRLWGAPGVAAGPELQERAASALLCNPAIERVTLR